MRMRTCECSSSYSASSVDSDDDEQSVVDGTIPQDDSFPEYIDRLCDEIHDILVEGNGLLDTLCPLRPSCSRSDRE